MELCRAAYEVALLHCRVFIAFIVISIFLAIFVEYFGKKKARGFFVMTMTWVVINFIVALLLFHHIRIPELAYLEKTLTHILNWVGINILLDFFYGICGLILLRRSHFRSKWSDYLWGFGVAVLFQSGGLLLLDLIFFYRVDVLYNTFLELVN